VRSKEKVSEAPPKQLQRMARKPRIYSLCGVTVVPERMEALTLEDFNQEKV